MPIFEFDSSKHDARIVEALAELILANASKEQAVAYAIAKDLRKHAEVLRKPADESLAMPD